MECPYCLYEMSKVTNKRPSPNGIRRRRECLKCKKRFTTYENILKNDIYVLKKNGSREKFNIQKLEKGVKRAFEKRPISEQDIEKLLLIVEKQIRNKGKNDVKSSVIGELVARKIKKLDNVAYLRFASVYKNFQNISDFKEELKILKLK